MALKAEQVQLKILNEKKAAFVARMGNGDKESKRKMNKDLGMRSDLE